MLYQYTLSWGVFSQTLTMLGIDCIGSFNPTIIRLRLGGHLKGGPKSLPEKPNKFEIFDINCFIIKWAISTISRREQITFYEMMTTTAQGVEFLILLDTLPQFPEPIPCFFLNPTCLTGLKAKLYIFWFAQGG
ncbi:MAG: hypothetical protein H0A76_12440 [Candidatus Thiodubiliella endoseptemdiera]|uniref:Uncharacterized protein n=1 Tax=Candidatus Thiodubiliella endoseptemdiera TaxID=2738886 RepID=A0A853F5D6_9GAMM|nr:hypothetical protein [Candidatus Thiodubiliella endoseptemdiera]